MFGAAKPSQPHLYLVSCKSNPTKVASVTAISKYDAINKVKATAFGTGPYIVKLAPKMRKK